MEVNASDQTSTGNPVQPIRRARFRRGPATSQAPAERPTQTQMLYKGECLEMPPYTYRCTSGISMPTASASSSHTYQTQTQRSDLSGVRLNRPLDNPGPSGSCSAASLDRSTVITGGPTAIVTEALEEDEASVYNGRRAGFTKFLKPSTTTAMSMPGAEEATVYNGKIGSLLVSRHQSGATNLAAMTALTPTVRNEAIFDQNGERLISLGKLTSSHSAAVLAEEGTTAVHKTSPISDKTSRARLSLLKRSRQGDMTEIGTIQLGTSVPEYLLQSGIEDDPTIQGRKEAGTSSQLPAPAVRPFVSSCHKRSKTETIRVLAVNSKKSEVPPDGYRWWKYGEKQIKGSPYSRSYYKCKTQDACLATKNVMRAVDEPSMLDVTYNGGHCHDPPQKLNAMSDAATSSIVPSTSAATAGTVLGTVPTGPLEEQTTTRLTQFFEFL